ncbi:MAG: hypothetical protein ACYC99_11175 [Candidatus Geothermincolia bacterium]
MKLDWEQKYYDFDADECRYRWYDIRMVALRSELQEYPNAQPGDLLVTFRDRLNAKKILEHFDARENFRHGFLDVKDGHTLVHVLLSPLEGRNRRVLEPARPA